MSETRSPISPTAHYTGAVWTRNGLSHPALATSTGRFMYESMRLPLAASRALGGVGLEQMLLARHGLIDTLLEAAIESGEVSQVIEIAAGLSPRGWRFADRYGDRLTYIETDLPEMAERKRRALEEAESLTPEHRVVLLDALSEEGTMSLSSVAARLDPERGVAVVVEGLVSYLERDPILDLWRRTARALSPFPHGLMLSDLQLRSDNAIWTTALGARLLSLFVRGPVGIHFEGEADAVDAVEAAGFGEARLHRGSEVSEDPSAATIRVIEARRG